MWESAPSEEGPPQRTHLSKAPVEFVCYQTFPPIGIELYQDLTSQKYIFLISKIWVLYQWTED